MTTPARYYCLHPRHRHRTLAEAAACCWAPTPEAPKLETFPWNPSKK